MAIEGGKMKNIGDTIFWVESGTNYCKQIPCPMCFGKRIVTIILGDDSQTKIECGFCQRGTDRPSGMATTWEPSAITQSGTITGVSTRDGVKYEVGHKSINEYETYPTKEIAEIVRLAKFEEVQARADLWFKESFVTAKKKQIWSAGYNRDCIARAKRTIEWHESRLGMIADKAKGDAK